MSWKTVSGRRPDLEAMEVNAPFGYIGNRIYPVESVMKSSGKMYYVPTPEDVGTAQTGRDQKTGTITRNFVASANKDYVCTERVYRSSVTKFEVENMFGIEKADARGGRMAKRGVMTKIESEQATKLYTGTSHAVTSGNLIDSITAAAEAIRFNQGPAALVLSHTLWRKIIKLDEITARLKWNGFNFSSPDQVLTLKTDVILNMLKGIVAVDEILIGDDLIWNASSFVGKAAVVKLTPPEEASYSEYPVLGKTIAYMIGDNSTPFEIEASSDDSVKVNDYDSTAYIDLTEFNAGAKYILSGLDQLEVVKSETTP